MAGLRELYSTTSALLALAVSAAATGENAGVIIDTRDNDSHLFIALLGDLEAAESVTLKIEEGDDPALADAADAGGADVIVDFNTNEAGGPNTVVVDTIGATVAKIAYVGDKRYIRLVATVAGGDGVDLAAAYVGGHLHQVPVRALPQ